MARLSLNQIKEILKKPKNSRNILLAAKQERRLQLHTEAVQDRSQLNFSPAFSDFVAWVRSFLPDDKFETFSKLITLPVPTNEQCETIYTEIKKVFEAQDAQKQTFFVDPAYQKDSEDYLQRNHITDFMQTVGWEAIKLQLCSFIVVDMPSVQLSPRPEPYTYIVNVSSVFDIDINQFLKIEYIIWRTKGPNNEMRFCIVDFENYWVLESVADDYTVILQNAHSYFTPAGVLISGLGYTPVHKIYPTATRSTNYIDSIGPITNQLGDFDWFWMEKVSFRYFALYGYYPIIAAYEQECDYKDNEGRYCEKGRIEYILEGDKSEWHACPVCAGKKTLGPGSFWTARAPRNADEVDLVAHPVTVVDLAPTEKLQFAKDSLEDLKEEIFKSCVGFDGSPDNNQAKNEKQVQSSFESRSSVLTKVATNIDTVESFIYDTALTLRYGNLYLGSNIRKGSQFYLQTAEEADAAYKVAKDAGKPQHELEALRIMANNIKNKNNPEGRQRVVILQQLEPWCDLSIDDVVNLGLNITNPDDYYLKVNFGTYIARFERENMNIVEFGSAVDFRIKINNILARLKTYVQETKAESVAPPAPVVNKSPIAA